MIADRFDVLGPLGSGSFAYALVARDVRCYPAQGFDCVIVSTD